MGDAILRAKNISKSFGALKASHDISLELNTGEIHALIGPNGAGKSTLIKLLCGNIAPDAGQIYLDAQDITPLSTSERAKLGLGRSFQISTLAMEYTVLQNAALGALGASGYVMRFWKPVMKDEALVSKARAALERVGLEDKANAITGSLSHGERRQLELAVALTLEPKIFLMDEPMAGLGVEGGARLTELLGGLKAQAPILLVEHDMDAVFALADRISVLVNGEIICTGPPDEIRHNKDVQTAYLGDEAPP